LSHVLINQTMGRQLLDLIAKPVWPHILF